MPGFTHGGENGAQYGRDDGGLWGLPLLYPPIDLVVANVTKTSAELKWTDNNPDEYGVVIERQEEYETGFGPWIQVGKVGENVETFTDDTLQPGRTYNYRIGATNVAGTEYSTEVETTAANREADLSKVPRDGWHIVITHPQTGRKLVPEPLDDPEILPSLNSLPEIRVPVRPDSKWLDPALEDNPDMAVYLDGERQPIDELREVDDRQERTVLVGVGGTELRQRVQAEYTSEKRYVAAEDLVTSETGYAGDIDAPQSSELTDQTQQDVTTTTEFENNVPVDATDPINISDKSATIYQTCFTREAESANASTASDVLGDDDYSGGDGLNFNSSGQYAEWDFSLDYDIPDGNVALRIRYETGSGTTGNFDFDIDGVTVNSTAFFDAQLQWFEISVDNLNGLSAGDHTLRIEQTNSGDVAMALDVVAVYDDRFSYTFDNTLNEPQGYLDGPEFHPPAYDVVTDDSTTAFSFVAGMADITIDDTSNNQRLQVSNDRGANYYPDDGSEQNTTSVDVDPLPTTGASLRMRATLSRYEPNGVRDQTPRYGYDAQTLSAYELSADITAETLLIDQKFDDALWRILNEIAGTAKTEYLWSYNLDANGNPQVSWTQPGQRVAGRDPDLGDASITKDLDIYERVTVKGSNKEVSSVSFTASSTFESLPDDDIVTGSESVYDGSGTNFERGVDYEMDYSAGEIRALDGGSLTNGDTYQIDYQAETSGTYTVDGAGSNPREFVDEVAGIVSDRAATQVAFVLAEEYSTPRYSGTLEIPRSDVTFDPLEALALENLDLPAEATPLDVRGEPQITPSGVGLRLGSRGRIGEALSGISRTVGSLSQRS